MHKDRNNSEIVVKFQSVAIYSRNKGPSYNTREVLLIQVVQKWAGHRSVRTQRVLSVGT